MKILSFLLSLSTLILLYSCNQNPKHPQAELISQESATAMTDQSIRLYTDSIDANLNTLEKESSLIFQSGDQSMYVEKYSYNGEPIVYAEYTDNILINSSRKKYYFKNDSLILIKEVSKSVKEPVYDDTRIYLRNNIAFKIESRLAASNSALAAKPYSTVPATKTSAQTKTDYKENIRILDNAINGKDKFDMRFENIISAPDESYIQLKSNIQNGYTVSVLVTAIDPLIDSLINNPAKFKNEKLNFKWKIVDREVVYVPVASSITSAKGLNK